MTTRALAMPWNAFATALPVSPEVAVSTVSAAPERRHEPRHHARPEVLERQRRTVKQLERENAGLDLDQRRLEVERVVDDRGQRARVDRARDERLEHAHADVSQRHPRQLVDLTGRPRLDDLRHIEAPIGREAVEERRAERCSGRFAACRNESHCFRKSAITATT